MRPSHLLPVVALTFGLMVLAPLARGDGQPDTKEPKPQPKAAPKAAPKAPETSQVTPPANGENKEQAEAGKDPSKVEDYQLAYALNLLRGATLFAPKASN